jgi:hypothetical protein
MKQPKNLHLMYLHAQSIPSPLHSTYYGIVQLIADNGGKVHESEVSKFEQCGQFRSRFTIENNEWSCAWLQFHQEKKESEKRAGFAPPTTNEVAAYMIEKGLDSTGSQIESNKFVNFYTAKRWMIGKNKMADWKAAVRNWILANTPKVVNNGTEKVGSRNTREGLNAMRDALNGGTTKG